MTKKFEKNQFVIITEDYKASCGNILAKKGNLAKVHNPIPDRDNDIEIYSKKSLEDIERKFYVCADHFAIPTEEEFNNGIHGYESN